MSAAKKGSDPKSKDAGTSQSKVKPTIFISTLHPVGGGYSVQFAAIKTADGISHINCEWSPRLPTVVGPAPEG